ncbi:LysR family transcriptional regulator [Jongsikchunia kroppenstedtii]|uniref:LysR family transcriptional regulator n=1 Tax=Jongsikchunia kroppenstedtii TaxID=1121721 RepID=UPI000365FC9F|nr:LysR family transcriptional regulator [Jongsikchunia kroppenstedtii]
MELHQLRYVVEVARRGSFTAAAQSLHVSQSGVSAQVAKLERELGVRIFARGSRIATPTSEGAALLPHARAALAAVSQIDSTAADLAGLVRGEVRVGTVVGCTIPGYLSAFAAFRDEHPDIAVSAREGNSDMLIQSLLAGDIDVALVAHAGPLPSEFDVYPIVDEPLAVGVQQQDPWAHRRSLPVARLVGQPVLTLPNGTGVRSALIKTCAAGGVDVVPAVEAHSPEALIALASHGVGKAVLTASMLAGSDLVAIRIEGSARTSLSLASAPTAGTAARAFANALRGGLAIRGATSS